MLSPHPHPRRLHKLCKTTKAKLKKIKKIAFHVQNTLDFAFFRMAIFHQEVGCSSQYVLKWKMPFLLKDSVLKICAALDAKKVLKATVSRRFWKPQELVFFLIQRSERKIFISAIYRGIMILFFSESLIIISSFTLKKIHWLDD